MTKKIDAWTDGACVRNGQKDCVGGIGVYFEDKNINNISELLPLKSQSNQKAEIYAIIRALERIEQEILFKNRKIEFVTIHTDSKYTINSINQWIYNWMRNGWKKANGENVKNKKLLIQLYNKIREFENNYGIVVELLFVKGHSGIYGNDMADSLAKQEIQNLS